MIAAELICINFQRIVHPVLAAAVTFDAYRKSLYEIAGTLMEK
jgi:hypothetical protein